MMKKAGACSVIKIRLPFKQESEISESRDAHLQPAPSNHTENVTSWTCTVEAVITPGGVIAVVCMGVRAPSPRILHGMKLTLSQADSQCSWSPSEADTERLIKIPYD
jgi:hypothetical protein